MRSKRTSIHVIEISIIERAKRAHSDIYVKCALFRVSSNVHAASSENKGKEAERGNRHSMLDLSLLFYIRVLLSLSF